MDHTYYAGPQAFEFDWHSGGRGKTSCFAINVKFFGFPDLPDEYEKRLERMERAKFTKKETLETYAWEDTRDWWWEWANDLASEYGLGKAYSAGRSGGWLVLEDYSIEKIEELFDEYNLCVNCRMMYSKHVKEKCLFQATRWKTDAAENLKVLEELKKFTEEIQASKASVDDDYIYRYQEIIDNQWQEFCLERRKERDEKRNRRPAVPSQPEGDSTATAAP